VSDNYLAGQQCAEHLLAHAAGGKIALLQHSEARSSVDRIQGFLDGLAINPNFEVVDRAECRGQLELAMPAMQEMLARHPDIDVVMALNDPTAMGAMAALQTVGRLDKVLVYGVDQGNDSGWAYDGHSRAVAQSFGAQCGRTGL